jgi:predicted component of type VI protein secretion system
MISTSTNGTFVNGLRIQGEHELRDGDHVKVGRLELRVATDVGTPDILASIDDEAAAVFLLTPQDDSPAPVNGEEIPAGSTLTVLPNSAEPNQGQLGQTPAPASPIVSISSVAGEILKKYRKARHSARAATV